MTIALAKIEPFANQPELIGQTRRQLVAVTMDASYPTGGESLTPAMLGLTTIAFVYGPIVLGYAPVYDYANSLLMAYWVDNNAVADSAMIEVADTTDLSTVVFRLEVVGI
jgi:hypothetical protein